jgi:hypothetical protein
MNDEDLKFDFLDYTDLLTNNKSEYSELFSSMMSDLNISRDKYGTINVTDEERIRADRKQKLETIFDKNELI